MPLAEPPWSGFATKLTYGLLKELAVQATPGVVSLHAGLPPPECFPITAVSVHLADGRTVDLDGLTAQRQYDVPPTGHPSLREWAREFTQKMHAPPLHVGHDTIITDGSTRGIDIVTSLFLDPGDAILVEEYTYSHFLETLAIPRGYNIVPVAMDDQGLEPTALRATLQRLKAEKKPIPRLLYVIPTGQNPTGSVASSQRITEVYTVCQDFDIFILEDDPYALLRFPSCYVTGGGSDQTPLPGLHGLCPMPSYLGRDTDGRVVRLDSFAKSIAPGLRLGWATAAPMIADRMAMAVQATSLGGAMLSQVLLAHVLASWGEQGLHEHLSKLQEAYATRAAAAVAAARTELQGLAEWTVPTAGMFMWIKMIGVPDTLDLMPDLLQHGVAVVPGRIMSAASVAAAASASSATAAEGVGDPRNSKCPYVRVSFSRATSEELAEGLRRLAQFLRSWRDNNQ